MWNRNRYSVTIKLEDLENEITESLPRESVNIQTENNISEKVHHVEITLEKLEAKFKSLEEEGNVQIKEACELMTGLVAEAEENEYFDNLLGFSCLEYDFVEDTHYKDTFKDIFQFL